MAIVGIDLGTTNSLISVWRNGKCELIPNSLGEYLTPSIVNVGKDGTIYVGKVAGEKLISDPDNTAASFKRMMGTAKKYRFSKQQFFAQELSSMILRRLKEDAEIYLNEKVTEAVISVPAYFNDKQRYATKQAGKLAGLTVRRLVNEPSAAALACCLNRDKREGYYMVVDFGGGTLDISIVEYFENIIEIIAVSGDNHLGGNDIDLALAKYFCDQHNFNFETMEPMKKASLLKEAEQCKIKLTTESLAAINLEINRENYAVFVDNNKLIEISSDIFKRFSDTIDKALVDSRISVDDINDFIMVGGSCKMPVISQFLKFKFHRDPVIIGSPDEIVALGAGTYAGIKERKEEIKDILLTDICPFSMGVSIYNEGNKERDLMSLIIERNSTLPCSKSEFYTTVHDNQTIIVLKVYQGENMYCEDNLYLGELEIRIPPAPKGKESVEVRMTYDIDGILEIEVKSKSTLKTERKVLYNKDLELLEHELEEKLKQLEKLKIHPRDQEVNQMILARGERLYQENLGGLRETIRVYIQEFEKILNEQKEHAIRKARENLNQFFDHIDRSDRKEQEAHFQEWLSQRDEGDLW